MIEDISRTPAGEECEQEQRVMMPTVIVHDRKD
jgi:hypothetical protein